MWVSTVSGNVGGDGEIRVLAKGDPVLNFSVAHSDKDRDGKETTTWIRCAIFGPRAEKLAQYITKGKAVTVVGAMSVRHFEAQGEKRQSIEMRVDHLGFGSSAKGAEGANPSSGARGAPTGGGYGGGRGGPPAGTSDNEGGGEGDFPYASCSPSDDPMMRGMATA